MDNFYRAKDKENNWVYGIYLPLLDGACIIPDDAKICKMQKKVEDTLIKGHLIETVAVERDTLGLCLGVEDSEGMPVFTGDYLKVTGAAGSEVLEVKEKRGGFKLCGAGTAVNAVKYLKRLVKNGGSFTVCGNVYDNAGQAQRKTA